LFSKNDKSSSFFPTKDGVVTFCLLEQYELVHNMLIILYGEHKWRHHEILPSEELSAIITFSFPIGLPMPGCPVFLFMSFAKSV
jgi:hypothetical protein